jgi:hypothetical protein
MGRLARMRSFWRNALHRSNMERDMSDELQFHLAARAKDLVECRGVSPEEAMRMARLEFGSWRNTRKRLGRVLDSSW